MEYWSNGMGEWNDGMQLRSLRPFHHSSIPTFHHSGSKARVNGIAAKD